MGGFPIHIASVEDREPTHEELYPEPPPRRARGGLESDIARVLQEILIGEQPAPNGPLTPYRISRLVQARDELAVRPSTGGVTDVVKRWHKIGAIEVRKDPYAFHGFTEAYYEVGLEELHRSYKLAHKK